MPEHDSNVSGNTFSMPGPNIKVLFIVGCSRSGSTVMDAVLASHADAVGLGELQSLPKAGWMGEDYCGCGVHVHQCQFWTAVRERWSAETGAEAEDYLDLQRKVSRLRQLPRLLAPSLLRGAWFGPYRDLTTALLRAIAREAGVSTLIDSSKNPVRAMALSRLPDIDLRLIHLVRDPRGVAASLMKSWKPDPQRGIQQAIAGMSAGQVARSWNLVNRFSEGVVRRTAKPRAIRIRYEDVLADPTKQLAAIGTMASMDFSEVAAGIEQEKPVSFGHMVAGNRLRMKGSAPLRRSDDWSDRIDDASCRIIQHRCRRGMARYGYHPRDGDAS